MVEETKPRRLCSEIQLFDLCSLENCKCRDGRYCGDESIIAKFETISEDEMDYSDQFLIDELEDLEDSDDAEYDEDSNQAFDSDYDEDEDEE
jgi:hypothetical protein